jgi:hypothetical protein
MLRSSWQTFISMMHFAEPAIAPDTKPKSSTLLSLPTNEYHVAQLYPKRRQPFVREYIYTTEKKERSPHIAQMMSTFLHLPIEEGVPLALVMEKKDGTRKQLLQTKKVSEMMLPNSIFDVPMDYKNAPLTDIVSHKQAVGLEEMIDGMGIGK